MLVNVFNLKNIKVFPLLLVLCIMCWAEDTLDSTNEPTSLITSITNDNIAYLRISYICESERIQLQDFLHKNVNIKFKGLIIDLRNCPGGTLAECIRVAELFLPRKSLFVTVVNSVHKGQKDFFCYKKPLVSKRTQIVMIVNNHTSAGAELLSGAFQDYDRATIIGDTTAGIGTITTEDGKPIGDMYTPSGRSLQRNTEVREYKTKRGKIVKSGFGVIPDKIFNSESCENSNLNAKPLIEQDKCIINALDEIRKAK